MLVSLKITCTRVLISAHQSFSRDGQFPTSPNIYIIHKLWNIIHLLYVSPLAQQAPQHSLQYIDLRHMHVL